MFCNQCGSNIPDDSQICANCGASVVKVQPVASIPEQPPKKKSRVGLINSAAFVGNCGIAGGRIPF